jgi:gluconokinase
MASGTGLYDRYRNGWDKKLCSVCGVNPSQLPKLVSSDIARRRIFKLETLPRIFTAIGDGAASNLGSGAEAPGVIAINIGTSAAVRTIRQKEANRIANLPMGLFEYVVDDDRFLVGGAVSNAGNLRQWALRELQVDDTTATNRLVYSRTAAANDRLRALPFWAGERAPTWPNDQFGVIDGITQSTEGTDIMRALTCSVFYRLADILDLLPTHRTRPLRLIVSGGILRSPAEVQLLADALGHDLEMAGAREASLRGAGVYALQQLNMNISPVRAGRRVKHDPALAKLHQFRRQRQRELERTLSASR